MVYSLCGGSKPILIRANDGHRYWIKPTNNKQGQMVPVTEQIVGRAGALIDAPVATVRTISVPEGAESEAACIQKSYKLEEGIAHGSRDVGIVDLQKSSPQHYNDDRNARRFAYLLALYDWCWGGDPQYLRAKNEDKACYSHDHGWFLPPSGKTWSVQKMKDTADKGRPLSCNEQKIEREALEGVIDALREIDRQSVADEVLSPIPDSWIADDKLEVVGCYLEYRAPGTAARLEERFQL